MAEKTLEEEVADKMDRLHEQADEAAFVSFIKLSDIGRDNGSEASQIIGLLNAAAIACKLGNYDLCFAVLDNALKVNEEIVTNYIQEQPRMFEMLQMLSETGAFNKLEQEVRKENNGLNKTSHNKTY
ncbi:MAG: hypothetical protein FWD47_14645 [Treponema sp.]|nr:hypothetical protein [Treponema sp.]